MTSQNAIEITGLVKSFDQFTLGELDLAVPTGAIYGFIGPNGAGKTTTLDLMFGMGAPDEGEIRILGFDHAREEVAVKQAAAYMSSELRYTRWKFVGQAMEFIRSFYPSWDQGLCDSLMQRFALDVNSKTVSLSLGGHVKLALVLALARRPKLLVLDEPTSGLDPIARRELFAELLSAIKDGANTVLMASHNLADLERFADHIGLINGGKMLLEGACDDLLESYKHIDFTLDGQIPEGARLVEREGGRVRVISESSQSYTDALKRQGAEQIQVQPLSLEELFVGMVREA